MALDEGLHRCVWEVGEWGKKKEIRIEPGKPVRMGFAIKTLSMKPHVEVVDLRPDTAYTVWPCREGDRMWFEIRVDKLWNLPPKKSRRWKR